MRTPLMEPAVLSQPQLAEPAFLPSSVPVERPMVMQELLMFPSETIIPGQPACKLKCDLFASIDWNGDGVLIRSELLDEEGYGSSYEEAWQDFLESLRDKQASLARRRDVLSAADRRVLDQLRVCIDFG